MERKIVYRIRTRGHGLTPGVYTSRALAEEHVAAWTAADVAAHGETTKRGSAFGVLGIEEESLYVEGGESIPPHDLPRPAAPAAPGANTFGLPGLRIEGDIAVTNPGDG